MFVNVGADGEGGRFNNNIRCIEILTLPTIFTAFKCLITT